MSKKEIAAEPPDAGVRNTASTDTADRPDLVRKKAEADAVREVSESGKQEEVEAALAPLRGLLERGDDEGARQLVGLLMQQWPDSPRLQHLATVLAPPTVRVRADLKPLNHDREREWLRAHAHEYSGCWIAVLGDQLVAADRELKVVVSRMKQDPALQDAILFFAGRNPE